MFSQDQSTSINMQQQAEENFFDDSILFSQHSNYGNNFELQTPFTVKGQTDTDQLEPNDFSRFLSRHDNVEEPQQLVIITTRSNDEEEAKSEKLKSIVQYANYTLQSYGFSVLGDLLSPTEEDIQKTVNTVLEMIVQRQRDVEFRKEISERMAKSESDKKMYFDQVERKKAECAQLSKEIGSLKNEILMKEKKAKSEKEKICNEKEELTKQLNKFTQKIAQYQHEIRKKEVEVNKIKDQVRNNVLERMGTRSSISGISSFEYKNSFHSKQSSVVRSLEKAELSKSNENDFTVMVSTTVDNYQSKLLTENQDLRKCLQSFFGDLAALVSMKKEELISKKINDSNSEDSLSIRMFYEKHFEGAQFTILRSGALDLPFDKAVAELQGVFRENLKSLETFFDKITQLSFANRFIGDVAKEFSELDDGFSSIKNIVELRKAIKNFKSKNNEYCDNDINKENCIETRAPMGKSNSVSPIIKESNQCDDAKLTTEFMVTSQDDSSFEDPPIFINKKQDSQSPQVKRARPEVNKWKLGLHIKTNSVAITAQNDANSGSQENK